MLRTAIVGGVAAGSPLEGKISETDSVAVYEPYIPNLEVPNR